MRRHERGTESRRGTFEADRAAEKVEELRTRIAQGLQGRPRRNIDYITYAASLPQDRRESWRVVREQYHEVGYGERTPLEWMREAGRDPEALRLGRDFLRVAERGDAAAVRVFLKAGFPANWQDPDNGATALHVAAGAKARTVVRMLVETGFCDYLLRDAQGRLPSELAYLYGEDPAMARLLGNKERRQAEVQGITLKRRGAPTHHLVRR